MEARPAVINNANNDNARISKQMNNNQQYEEDLMLFRFFSATPLVLESYYCDVIG